MSTANHPGSGGMPISRVAFYFSPHPDDWQLFMMPAAFRDVRNAGTKTVFVHVTAGDAGDGVGRDPCPYYLAREAGAEAAVRFMADAEAESPGAVTESPAILNGHAVRRAVYRGTVAYFLRLPDGSPGGTGYPGTGLQSLARLCDGRIDTMAAIDATATYRGWADITATLRALIAQESAGAGTIDLHVPDPDIAHNPDDHSDHIMTGKAALDAARGLSGVRRCHHLGYVSAKRPDNLHGAGRDMKAAVYAVTLAALQARGVATSWLHYDQQFAGRDYVRVDEA